MGLRWLLVGVAVVLLGCQVPAATECANGALCPPGLKCVPDPQTVLCVPPTCGNGVLDPNEGCDDGNNIGGDGCPADCGTTCGDGVLDPGEACDDGNTVSGDGCSQDCKVAEACGNAHLDPPEACDDGNRRDHDGCSSHCTLESPAWTTTASSPPARAGAAIAYDAIRGQIVMFGGCTISGPGTDCLGAVRQDTWVWDGARWLDASPTFGPPARVFSATAFDASRGKVVMFGGCSDLTCAVPLDDTWEWDGTRWVASMPATRPSARSGHAMAYDAARHSIVLFGGGRLDEPELPQDTWEYDGTTWIERTPATSPPGRQLHAMAFDPSRGRIVLLGGQRPGMALNDTWEWDGTTWVVRTPTTSPPNTLGHALVYDPARHEIVALAGCTPAGVLCLPGELKKSAWAWNGVTWSRLLGAEPPARVFAAIAYDSAHDRIVEVGGVDSTLTTRGETYTWNGAGWSERGRVAKPEPRVWATAAYDSLRDRMVVFGGGYQLVADTWEHDGTSWIQRSPSTSPPPRRQHAMAYDAAHGVVVMFGGVDQVGTKSDTWLWDGTSWTLANPSTTPPARAAHAMIYDAARGKVVMFGGCPGEISTCASATPFSDTWEWDGSSWTERHPTTSPPARGGHALAFDPARSRVVMFGGLHDPGAIGDTWEWDGSNWAAIATATAPSPRAAHTMVFDGDRASIVLAGGCGLFLGGVCGSEELSDVWSWDGTSWHALPGSALPGPRAAHAMVSTNRGTALIFGGETHDDLNVVPLGDTWELVTSGWIERGHAVPTPRAGALMTYDVLRGRVVLFGGSDAVQRTNDTWEWNGTEWIGLHPSVSPPERVGGALAYDAAHHVSVLFGGSWLGSADARTWTWDGVTWTPLTPAVSPPPRSNHAMAYDPVRHRIVLFGGYSGGGNLSDTWEWDGTTWDAKAPQTSPPGTGPMAFDAARGEVVMFGGTNLEDLWAWDGTTWSKIAAGSGPAPRQAFAVAYVPERSSLIVFGGHGNGAPLADTWEWNGTAWSQLGPTVSPSARDSMPMVYDASHQRLVLFGGADSMHFLDDTWLLQFVDEARPAEVCETGFDGNGNGVAGCADPTCEGSCAMCGDGTCGAVEDCTLCPGDCGPCNVCGDLHCDAGESCASCPGDCGGC